MKEVLKRENARLIESRSGEFRSIYMQNLWRGEVSRSGPGSEGAFAQEKASLLEQIVRQYNIKCICDIGCGDFFWMQNVVPSLSCYLGVDIVPELIAENIRRYSAFNTGFLTLDLAAPDESWKQVGCKLWDLVACIDVFGHLLNDEVDTALALLVSSIPARYLIVTNRRDAQSHRYLKQAKSRSEGIDIELHPLFANSHWEKAATFKARYPDDWFDLYKSTAS